MDKRIVHQVFEHFAARFPENIAVEHAGHSLSYAQLNKQADVLAQTLRTNGIGHQTLVGILMPTGLEYLISILGIAKAGCIFVPLTVDFPKQRLTTLLDHTRPKVILTDLNNSNLLKELCIAGSFPCMLALVLALDMCHDMTESFSEDCPSGPDDGLYIMHTSGSTGAPKAILGCHKGLSHFVHWEIQEFGLDQNLRVSLLAPPTFDVSLRDIFVPLMAGGTICIPDPETRLHSSLLLNWLDLAKISLIHCTPSVFRLLISELEMRSTGNSILHPSFLSALQRILLAGEPLYGEDINRWQSVMGNRVELVNLYGPTETTLAKLYHRIAFQPYDREQIIPLGLPISNTAVLILKDNRLCHIGEKGDIHIKTPFRTKGYYLDPELTAQCFIQNPLNPDAADIIYCTGDQGRYRPDRSVEFLGREDGQIKRHGIRVEILEIEQALRSHEAVAESLIIVSAGHSDNPAQISYSQILAYFTEKTPVSSADLRVHLQRLLPDYMIPDFFIPLKAFPRNSHGKTDRSALPLPALRHCLSLPETDTEIKLAAIWQDVLSAPVVGKTDSFFDVGGNSLNAMRILARIYHEMDREITLKEFFSHPRLQDMASLLDSSPEMGYAPIDTAHDQLDQNIQISSIWPLSTAQHRLWVLHQMKDGEAAYNIPIAYECRGPFDFALWRQALETMIQRHGSFRTSFIFQDNQPCQQIRPLPPAEGSWEVGISKYIDLSATPDPLAVCRDQVQLLAGTPFDLSQAPLLRAVVYKIGFEHHVLALVVHHIVSDAWSMDILAREMAVLADALVPATRAYAANAAYTANAGMPECWNSDISAYRHIDILHSKLPPLPCQYTDYTLWQKRLIDSPKAKAHRNYWHQQLAGDLPALDLATDFIRPAVQTFTGSATHFFLDEMMTEKLSDLGRNHQASLFMVIQSLIKILLFRYTGQTDICIGAPVSGRTHPDVSGLIGCFINMLVLRDEIRPDQSASSFLDQIRHTTMEALEHQDYPFDQLVAELVLERDISRSPLVDVGLTLYEADPVVIEAVSTLHGTGSPLHGAGKSLKLTPFAFEWPISKLDLIFTFRPVGKQLDGEIRFRTDLFQPQTIHRMVEHLKMLVRSVSENPATPIGALTMLPDDEKMLVCSDFASGGRGESCIRPIEGHVHPIEGRIQDSPLRIPISAPCTLPPLLITAKIDQLARQTPDQIAVACGNSLLSYRELNQTSDALARYLSSLGVGAETPVAVLLNRSPSWVMAMIGIMKAGGVYLPIDPQYPESRIQFMLRDSKCRFLLTENTFWELSAAFDHLQRIDLNEIFKLDLSSDLWPLPDVTPGQIAYMIYTSGSTGTPKGVMVPHRGPVNMALDQIHRFGILGTDRVLQFASPGFDASLYEMYLAFFSGATLVIAPPTEIQDPDRFLKYLDAQHVTLATLPPVYLGTLKRALPDCVRTVITAGEAAVASDAMYYGSRIQYINAYGPTETSVCAACHRVTANNSYPQGIPIGKPLCGIQIFILDAKLEPVPIGIPGEICISGIGLARGYHNRPELTEQVFAPHPFLKTDLEPEKRLYRSGDIGKWLPDGNILFLGRRDEQVKIRGHRIELQEIAMTLRGQPGIRDAVVFVHPVLNPAGLELLAYYIPQSAGKIAKMEVEAGQLACPDSVASTLSESVLKQALSRQLPAYMVPSHIISVESFPLTANGKIDRQALPDPWRETGSKAVQATSEGTTGILIQIWRQVLGRDHIELNDNFFALGGDSIKAIQVSARLHERHLHLQVADIYRFPSIGELVGLIQAASSDINAEPAWGQTRLTPIQSWFFDTFSDHSHHFNQAVLLEPTIPLKLPALKAALQSLLDHHDVLRSWFSQGAGGWFQTYEPPGMEIDIITEDWSLLSDAANPITDRFRIHTAKMQASFDLTRPPLLRVVWYKLPDGERLLIVIHHLVVDTVSWSILLEDLDMSYQAVIREQSVVLPAKTDGFKKWAERLQILASDPSFLAEIPFWRRQIAALAETKIGSRHGAAIVLRGDKKTNLSTLDRPSSFRYTYQNVRTLRFQLSDYQTNVLLSRGQHIYRATAQELLLAGLATAFYNWDGRLRLSLAMEHHGREGSITGADPLRTVGWFTSLFPMMLTAEPDLDPGSQVRSVQRSLSELPGRGIGYGVLRYLGEERLRADLNTEHWPSVSFNYLGQLGLTAQQSFFRVVSEPVGPLVAPDAFRLHDLDIQAWIHQDALHASIYFHPDQIPTDSVQNLLALYQKALMAQILDGALGLEATSTAKSRDQSPSLLSEDLRFCGLSDADLEKAMGDN